MSDPTPPPPGPESRPQPRPPTDPAVPSDAADLDGHPQPPPGRVPAGDEPGPAPTESAGQPAAAATGPDPAPESDRESDPASGEDALATGVAAAVAAADVTDTPPAPATRRWTRRRLGLAILVGLIVMVILILLRACLPGPAQVVTVVAAGDMACDPIDPRHRDPATATTTDGQPPPDPLWCREKDVSDIAVGIGPDAVLGLGDYQYEVPSAKAYASTYAPTWGRLKDITIPAIGNQEYKVHEANTFTAYFAGQTGPEEHYWSTRLGAWHVVVLNSNCTTVLGGCGKGSPQQKWLAADLAANNSRCTLAIWHHPRWSNGINGPDARTADLYQTLAENHVDIVISGHEADYERFPTLDGAGQPDPNGVRQFVVGGGGQVVYDPSGEPNRQPTDHNAIEDDAYRTTTAIPASDFADFTHPGLLVLKLAPDSYDWAFHAVNVQTDEPNNQILDSGTAKCIQ